MEIDYEYLGQQLGSVEIEALGSYILKCLRQSTSSDSQKLEFVQDQETLVGLIYAFEEKIGKIRPTSRKDYKLRTEMKLMLDLIVDTYNDRFDYGSHREQRKARHIYLYTERSVLAHTQCNCINCSIPLNQGWHYSSSEGDIYFCTRCKNEMLRKTSTKQVDMWSRMTFSAMESNRRKH